MVVRVTVTIALMLEPQSQILNWFASANELAVRPAVERPNAEPASAEVSCVEVGDMYQTLYRDTTHFALQLQGDGAKRPCSSDDHMTTRQCGRLPLVAPWQLISGGTNRKYRSVLTASPLVPRWGLLQAG